MRAMQKSGPKKHRGNHGNRRRNGFKMKSWWPGILAAACVAHPVSKGFAQSTNTVASGNDALLDLFVQKGFVTQEEADKVKAEADSMNTNSIGADSGSKWKIGSGIKNIELFGDLRLRYEHRSASDQFGAIKLDRLRYAFRLGLRGDAFDDFYYGFRMETSANPRSPWVTLGGNDGGSGVFSKSGSGIYVGQIYLGWHPEDWLDITVGKMPNPLYTTPMVWDSDLSPEGVAEHFKYTVGHADFLVTFGQFLYQDTNPTQTSPGFFNPLTVNSADLPFLFVWQGGFNFHITKDVNFKFEPALYEYYNNFHDGQAPNNSGVSYSPDYSGIYVGQGSSAGYPNAYYNESIPGQAGFDGFYSNEQGINNLLVLEFPFELDYKHFKNYDLSLFGDYAQNLQGSERATAAYNVSNSGYFDPNTGIQTALLRISSPQTHDDKAYQIGVSIASKDGLGLVYGASAKKNAWEFRTYWQHVEQYALDPNLVDSDFFEGAENLQGVYFAFAYALSNNMIGTLRYGHANRINSQLGTGGSDADIPQMNPVNVYNLFQADLTFRF
jgi:hypothetical protein